VFRYLARLVAGVFVEPGSKVEWEIEPCGLRDPIRRYGDVVECREGWCVVKVDYPPRERRCPYVTVEEARLRQAL
jgi:hypothetical protein